MYIVLLCMYMLTTDLMTDYDKRQTRPLVREGAPNWQDRNFLYIISDHEPQMGLDTKTDLLTDRQS
jgi:hypothetical protein